MYTAGAGSGTGAGAWCNCSWLSRVLKAALSSPSASCASGRAMRLATSASVCRSACGWLVTSFTAGWAGAGAAAAAAWALANASAIMGSRLAMAWGANMKGGGMKALLGYCIMKPGGGMKQGMPCAQPPLPVLCTAVPSEPDDADEVGTGTPMAGAMHCMAGSGSLTTAPDCMAGSCLMLVMAAAGELVPDRRGALAGGGAGAAGAGAMTSCSIAENLDLRLVLPPSRRKCFCAWLATCVGVLLGTKCLLIPRQLPLPSFSRPRRNATCSLADQGCPFRGPAEEASPCISTPSSPDPLDGSCGSISAMSSE
mmetsp:Transcript_4219/g.10537  ORF Transcript_4219/g.10537 Transcript_4219/m.10537 type:complete len:311 (+) Transcript_4219:2987-3919(+)